jgi:hypothetical protein
MGDNYPTLVTITTDEYKELLAAVEKIKTVQRLLDCGAYVSPDAIYAALEVYVPKKAETNG